ncbi:hypothetical protein PHMEG_0009234 [Phytophthora megakarya]|uniref:Integrase catalytic domain-containing protein n=1 Tax=Phytophthora megakarya TaxID=4795 RepID=A0A225WGP4_9STRA|nr:hypothetical protein PHMEG_0009234 [Phytophthora megakarya]
MLCPHVKGGKMIKRPWSETINCNERNGVLHWDFLSLGDSFGSSKYLLVLKDHATHFCELVVVGVSDNGSHFKNEVVAELSRKLKTQQQFTLAYSPRINGSVERVNRDIL